MTRKKRLAAIQRTQLQLRKLELETGAYPFTPNDEMIKRMLFGLRNCGTNPCHAVSPSEGQTEMQAWGEYTLAQEGYTLADAIRRKDSKMFRDIADSIDAWANHQPDPMPDKLHLALIGYCDRGRAPFAMRKILAYLKTRGIKIDDNTPRIVRRKCKQLGFVIQGTPGRPKTKQGHLPGKKR